MSNEAASAQLMDLEQRRCKALIHRDAATLDAIWPADLMHIHSTGGVMGKDELMRYVLETLQFLQLERAELKVQVYGDAALMTGRQKARMQRVDKPEPVNADSWVTQLWVRRPQGWVQNHFHSVRAAEA